jgi:uncharacterized membrane protein
MARNSLAIALLVVALAGPAEAMYEYKVTGVAAGDVLNMREGVESAGQVSSAPIIGSIPADAEGVRGTGVTVEVGGSLWRQVVHGGVTGWVAARYLTEMQDNAFDVLPQDFKCTGTEPFWSMHFSASGAAREDPFGAAGKTRTAYVPEPARLASGRRNVWTIMLKSMAGSQPATAMFLRTDTCSDDMSDFTYPIEFILTEHRTDGVVLSGCCQLNR